MTKWGDPSHVSRRHLGAKHMSCSVRSRWPWDGCPLWAEHPRLLWQGLALRFVSMTFLLPGANLYSATVQYVNIYFSFLFLRTAVPAPLFSSYTTQILLLTVWFHSATLSTGISSNVQCHCTASRDPDSARGCSPVTGTAACLGFLSLSPRSKRDSME